MGIQSLVNTWGDRRSGLNRWQIKSDFETKMLVSYDTLVTIEVVGIPVTSYVGTGILASHLLVRLQCARSVSRLGEKRTCQLYK